MFLQAREFHVSLFAYAFIAAVLVTPSIFLFLHCRNVIAARAANLGFLAPLIPYALLIAGYFASFENVIETVWPELEQWLRQSMIAFFFAHVFLLCRYGDLQAVQSSSDTEDAPTWGPSWLELIIALFRCGVTTAIAACVAYFYTRLPGPIFAPELKGFIPASLCAALSVILFLLAQLWSPRPWEKYVWFFGTALLIFVPTHSQNLWDEQTGRIFKRAAEFVYFSQVYLVALFAAYVCLHLICWEAKPTTADSQPQ